MLRSTAALLMSAGLRGVWLPLEVRRFRPVLARLWHASGGQHLIRRNLCGSRSPAALALACKNSRHWCALSVVAERPHTARIRPVETDDYRLHGVSNKGSLPRTISSLPTCDMRKALKPRRAIRGDRRSLRVVPGR